MDPQSITFVPFGYFDENLLRDIAGAAEQEFLCSASIKEGHLDLSEFYDPTRRQYNGSKLLKEVDTNFSSDSGKTIGLFNVDIFIPILTFIFGQAILSGRAGIASHYRLSNERYGIDTDDAVLLERFKKEVLHELGHTYGLIHCYTPTCVMRSSTYVEDIDQKNASLCHDCRKAIDSLIM
jgi:archaemetzincin